MKSSDGLLPSGHPGSLPRTEASIGSPRSIPAIVVAAAAGVVLTTVLVVATRAGSPVPSVVELKRGGTVEGGPDVASAARVHRSIHSVADVQPLDEGWVVLDRRGTRVHLLDPQLDLRRSFGGRGEGPGELRAPTQIAVLADTLLAVLEESTLVLHLFTVGGDFVARRRVIFDHCPSGIQGDLAATPAGTLLVAGRCSASGGTRWLAAEISPAGGATVLLERRATEPGRIDPFLGIGLATVGGRLHLVQPDGCLLPLERARAGDARGGAERRAAILRCLPEAMPVPIPDSIRDALVARLPPRVAARYRLDLPEHLPRILGAVWSPDGTVLELPAPGGALHTAILRPDGVVDRVTGARSVRPGKDRLLVWTEEVDGTVFRTVPWARPERPGAAR